MFSHVNVNNADYGLTSSIIWAFLLLVTLARALIHRSALVRSSDRPLLGQKEQEGLNTSVDTGGTHLK